MQSTAYLSLDHTIVNGFPILRGISIYSEAPWSLTHMKGHLSTLVHKETGNSFEEARRKVIAAVEYVPAWQWMLPWIRDDGESHDKKQALRDDSARLQSWWGDQDPAKSEGAEALIPTIIRTNNWNDHQVGQLLYLFIQHRDSLGALRDFLEGQGEDEPSGDEPLGLLLLRGLVPDVVARRQLVVRLCSVGSYLGMKSLLEAEMPRPLTEGEKNTILNFIRGI